MKTCPSCGSDIADDATECLCGYTYDGAEDEIDETAAVRIPISFAKQHSLIATGFSDEGEVKIVAPNPLSTAHEGRSAQIVIQLLQNRHLAPQPCGRGGG